VYQFFFPSPDVVLRFVEGVSEKSRSSSSGSTGLRVGVEGRMAGGQGGRRRGGMLAAGWVGRLGGRESGGAPSLLDAPPTEINWEDQLRFWCQYW
jgi:hypothetical protein